ncbi:MAG: zincin-like metallopeptidase domain-containing protein [Sphingobium sp.]|uniref:Antirestriction protein ArdC n=1 Tax=Sphingobium scionense TaxID=1404341 RepID=A0A7W6PZJ8_9SPHN|nr:zincin-like metallopeptidase domain-containing protein [Sphingobium scionense]MBB4151467.1 antirestriction protein ArdC [Sphingobium scionense]MDX3901807.1 zincin-like metallopeptidase domain-containing protein [Sphingobium sp.]
MARKFKSRPAVPDRPTLYQDITNQIIAELEAGRVPWVQPWASAKAPLQMPHNASSSRCYSGINILILWHAVVSRGFSSNAFLTFRQALELGGNVCKGATGTTVVYAHRFTPGDERRQAAEEGRTPGTIPFLKRFTVFNLDQCEGLPDAYTAAIPRPDPDQILPEAEALIKATGADFRIGGDQAYYDVANDRVCVPPPSRYFDPINWNRTAFHELGHWTGSKERLDRDQSGRFGSETYGREELVAEMAGAFVCAALGIEPTVRHSDYIGAWLDIMRADDRAIVRAASAASKAADYLLAFRDAPGIEARSAPTERRAA